MRQKLSFVIAFVGVLGLLGLTPASATHTNNDKDPGNNPTHEDQPRPPVEQEGGTCAVAGTVNINNDQGTGGVGSGNANLDVQKDHNHYRFEDVAINCRGLTNFEGDFAVDAAGGTDGPGECDGEPGKDAKCHNDSHGEELTAGWSHGNCYAEDCPDKKDAKGAPDDIYIGTNTNPGTGDTTNLNEIVVTRVSDGVRSCQNVDPANPDTEECANWLKFCRGTHSDHGITEAGTGAPIPDCQNTHNNDGTLAGGTHASTGGGNVLAWGALQDWSHKTGAVVCFLAELELEPIRVKTEGDGTGKVDQALLEGIAQTWLGDSKADCAGKKN